MNEDRSSRHRGLATYRRPVGPDRAKVELLQPRVVPTPEEALRHPVVAGDRVDLLAARYYADPHQYWRIADANPTDSVESLVEPGILLAIPRSDR